jgi:hypothetical protein
LQHRIGWQHFGYARRSIGDVVPKTGQGGGVDGRDEERCEREESESHRDLVVISVAARFRKAPGERGNR